MIPSPAKCRSRIRALRAWIAACPPDKPGEKGSNRKLLLYGVVPEGYDLERWMKDDVNADESEPLDLVEGMTLDTWFYQHPGKVCGKEVLTTSREFPLTLKGTREDCERVFTHYLGPLKKRGVAKASAETSGSEQPEMEWRKLSRAELMDRAALWVEVWGSYPSFLTQHYQILAKYENGFVSTIVKANKQTARKLAGLLWDELEQEKTMEAEADAALALMQMVELEMGGLAGASNSTATYYQINDTLATITSERKSGKAMYRVETFRAWMPPFLLNCTLPCTNAAWFPSVKMCKRHVDEIDVLNYYAFSEETAKGYARAWLRTHPHRAEGIFELEH